MVHGWEYESWAATLLEDEGCCTKPIAGFVQKVVQKLEFLPHLLTDEQDLKNTLEGSELQCFQMHPACRCLKSCGQHAIQYAISVKIGPLWPTVNGLNGIGIKCAKAWLEVKWSLTEAGNTSWKEPQRSLLRPTDLWPTAPTHDMAQYVINGIAIAEHSKVCLQLQLELCIVYYCVFSCFFVVRCGNDFLVFAPLQSIAIWGLAANRQSKLRKLHLRQRLHPWYPVTRNVLWQSLAALAPRLLSAAKHQCRKPSTLQRGRDRMKREVEAQYQHIKIIKC